MVLLALVGIGIISCEKEDIKQTTQEAIIMNNAEDVIKTRSQGENGRFTENDCNEETTYCTAEVVVQPAVRQNLRDLSGDANACSTYFTNNPTILGSVLTTNQIQDLATGDAVLNYKTTTNNVDYHSLTMVSSQIDVLVIQVVN